MEFDLGYDLDEALKREALCKDDLQALRTPPIEGAPSNMTDKQLACFLDACNKNIEQARKVIKIYYDARRDGPELFHDRDPFNPKIQQCFDNQDYFPLPPTPSGYSIVYHRLNNPKASNYNFDDAVKTYFMLLDSCLYTQGPRPGLICLFDMTNVGLTHLLRVKISTVRKFFHYLQDGLPARLKAIHVLNAVSFFDKILYIIKPFIHAEILKMLFLHPTNANLTKFYDEWIPRSCLPSDYGGELKSVAELHQEHIGKFESLRSYYLAEEHQRNGSSELIEETKARMKSLEID
ncbi:alpha-tocopherol transfer protein-like [Topomyia yanbarensis]|uniref:alpha-tocopherol transfer protein-like n=1 Tax=Topomyia yanbarensis TaxID=2498891 RepID=UPI00273CA92E|nr:alpha-tocopherol transfer protein-like [Topomyia yanbarensis]XP_058821909.1 alpha-tocopherol transfer protein-like [Topomyia yanbarensis]